jgi:hypothetical protein
MRIDGLQQVLNRINSIEAKFAAKPAIDFSRYLAEAESGSEATLTTSAKSTNSTQV